MQLVKNNSIRYDHSLLEHEEEGSEARRLTQRACNSTLTLGDQQRLLTELEKCGDPLQVCVD